MPQRYAKSAKIHGKPIGQYHTSHSLKYEMRRYHRHDALYDVANQRYCTDFHAEHTQHVGSAGIFTALLSYILMFEFLTYDDGRVYVAKQITQYAGNYQLPNYVRYFHLSSPPPLTINFIGVPSRQNALRK